MKAANIGKTIVIWNELDDKKASELLDALKNIIVIYRSNINKIKEPIVIPIRLARNNDYISVVTKHNEILISMSKNTEDFQFSPILNGDYLYQSLGILKNAEYGITSKINTYLKYPSMDWVNLPFNQAFETYALTPNMNPEDFIKNLEKGTLSNMQKNFLKEVGFALENSSFSKELNDVIQEANSLFEER